jgi:hypothetical protein
MCKYKYLMCKYMLQKSTIIRIRQLLGIPQEGFSSNEKALSWYRDHYRQIKGKDFTGSFGFQYDNRSGYVDFEYEITQDFFKINGTSPLDNEVSLDREAITLLKEVKIPDWAAPCLRLVMLIGEPSEIINIRLPDYLMAPLGYFRILVHPEKKLSLKKWRKIGARLGLLLGDIDLWKVPGVITTYVPKRENTYELLYWQTYLAYMDAIGERRSLGKKGKKGLLVDTARILVRDYGWNMVEESYTIRRFLDRAEKIWHISTRFD